MMTGSKEEMPNSEAGVPSSEELDNAEKERESLAPRPSSPRRHVQAFSLLSARESLRSRVTKVGKDRARSLHRKFCRRPWRKGHTNQVGNWNRQKNRHPTEWWGAL